MHELRLMRDERPIPGKLFVAMPFGRKKLSDGSVFDFDELYTEVYAPTVAEIGMEAVRADSIYGPTTLLEPIWRGIQQAEAILVDFTGKNPNVAMEFALAYLVGKRMVYTSQHADDIPADVRGRLRHITYSVAFNDIAKMRHELKATLTAIRLEPAIEMTLVPMAAGGTVPVTAKVISVNREFAVVKTDDGRRGVLGCEDVDYARVIPDMGRRFTVGDSLDGAFEVDTNGGMKYTLLAGQVNPWNTLVTTYPPGRTFAGTVQNVTEVGVFVQLEGAVNGLVPRSMLPAGTAFTTGNRLEVSVDRIDPLRRRVWLKLVSVLGGPSAASVVRMGVRVGDRFEGEVSRVVPEGEGGFVLLRVPGRERPAFLHCTRMSAELRVDLNAGGIEIGEIIDIEVVETDGVRNRVLVKDIPEENDDARTATPEAAQPRAA